LVGANGGNGKQDDAEEQSDDNAAAVSATAFIVWVIFYLHSHISVNIFFCWRSPPMLRYSWLYAIDCMINKIYLIYSQV
jgi:hypothetical protein